MRPAFVSSIGYGTAPYFLQICLLFSVKKCCSYHSVLSHTENIMQGKCNWYSQETYVPFLLTIAGEPCIVRSVLIAFYISWRGIKRHIQLVWYFSPAQNRGTCIAVCPLHSVSVYLLNVLMQSVFLFVCFFPWIMVCNIVVRT